MKQQLRKTNERGCLERSEGGSVVQTDFDRAAEGVGVGGGLQQLFLLNRSAPQP